MVISSCANTLRRWEARSPGLEIEPRPVTEVVAVVMSIARSEDDIVARVGPVMLGVDVDGVERAAILIGNAPVGAIEIRLDVGGVVRAREGPASQQIAARKVGLGRARQPGRPCIHVALQRQLISARRIRIDPEARLAEVEVILRIRAAEELM